MRIYQLIVLSILVLQMAACGEQTPKANNVENKVALDVNGMPEIVFDTIVNDMGLINEGEQVLAWFEYENKGTAPLIIKDIKAGCGCTVPKWNAEPLEAGEKESIKIIFDSSGKRGMQDIRISVQSNAKNSKEELRIKAQVKSIN
jgi:hypothetical protein